MDQIRAFLSPLTDWIPPDVRGLLDVEAWWLIELAVALLLLLLLGLLVRGMFRRKRPKEEWDRNMRLQLDECPLPVRPPGVQWLYIYHLPVRLRLVVVAPPGKDAEVDALAVEKLLDAILPGLGGITANDRPRIRVWPRQLSQQGFTATFHRCTIRSEPEGEPSRWILVVGRAALGKQPVLLGLGLWAREANTIGRLTLEPHQWLDVLRLRTPEQRMPPEDDIPCALCGRPFPPDELTKHHCLPREKGGTQDHVEMLCRQCHGMVHATYTNETLAALYPTIERLRKAPELANYIRWARKQPSSRRKRNRPRRRKL